MSRPERRPRGEPAAPRDRARHSACSRQRVVNRILRVRDRPLALVCLLALLLFAPRFQRAQATGLIDLDLAHLAQRAQLVVLGRVETTATRWQDGRIFTDAVVHIEESLAGAAGETVRVTQAGGKVGDIAMRVTGAAELRPGDRSILFLASVRGAYRVVGAARGKIDVERDADGAESVRWGSSRQRPLRQALAEIRKIVERR